MKEDRLEQFVSQHKEEFNDLDAPVMAWDVIEKKIEKPRLSAWLPLAWKVAAAILIFASAWYLNDYFDAKQTRQVSKTDQASRIENPVLNELSDAEAYYTSQINNKQEELLKYTREHPEILEDLKKEFKELDKNNQELKRDLAESNADEKVIEAIIQSYRMKLEILEQVLTEMKEKKGNNSATPVSL
jgi:hypothetical protein